MKKNTASQVIGAQMVNDGSVDTAGTPFTGTVTIYVTGDNGTQTVGSVGSGACTHKGLGFHTYAPSQGETNYDHIAFTFTGTGAFNSTAQLYTEFPQTGDSFARIGAPVGASISADIAGVQVDTDDIQTRLPAALVSGRMDSSVGAMAAGVLTATAIAADAITDAKVASDVTIASVTGAVGSVPGNVGGNVTGSVGSVTGITASDIGAIKAKTDNLPSDPADASDIAGAFSTVNSTLATIAGYVDTEVAAIKAKTDLIPPSPAAVGDIPTALQNADALLNRDMSAVSDTNARSPLNALRFLRNKWALSGTTLSVKKEDDSTEAWSATVTTSAGADPISGSDPA